ncbi:ferredoxin [Kamptonema cortianum]|nr:ferredoxin [Oscillatoria laete-virens]MDK3156412.1 ferredoxin [Kamptonema cortianum]MDL5046271.1 ferredoxin [Oscillatoria amoena NRMC-F 0135]MDL5053907.1 ferredoxin [Oscillatoria laete-virens NRMC-F 0139]
MADFHDRFTENAPGEYYVDRTCVHCKLCMSIAPDHFTQEGYAGFVFRQPTRADEYSLCVEAKENCPVSAIGDDGLRMATAE